MQSFTEQTSVSVLDLNITTVISFARNIAHIA